MDRALVFGTSGYRFESCLVHMKLMIFTYAPAGLGHLRVTEALVETRPEKTAYILLGSVDRFMTWIHRFTSINPIGKFIFLQSQYGLAEDIFTTLYRKFLVFSSGSLFKQLKDIVVRSSDKDEVWIIATHFGMAHQIGAVKERLMLETGRVVRLIVQVTDDTSQQIWCVRGADLTFVSSKYIKGKLDAYAKATGIDFVSEVIPYPLSAVLTSKLPKGLGDRHMVLAEDSGTIKVAIPISGAAVGLEYIFKLVKALNSLSKRFEFLILVKKSPFTKKFISFVRKLDGAKALVGINDSEMISLYELLYKNNLVHLEITKPSEQAFKAILGPERVGGSLLLLTSAVGRQEIENMEFLERHGLLSATELTAHPRAIKLPGEPMKAAEFILWGVESGLFARMTAKNFRFSNESLKSGEIGADGARQFWEKTVRKFGK